MSLNLLLTSFVPDVLGVARTASEIALLRKASVGAARRIQLSRAFDAGLWVLPFVLYPMLALSGPATVRIEP